MRNILLLLSVFSIISCVSGYSHQVLNVGDKLLYSVEIESEGRSFGHGYVSPGVHSGYSGSLKISKNDKVKVSWGLDEEKRYSKEIYIDRNPGFKEVVFKLDGKDVTVGYE